MRFDLASSRDWKIVTAAYALAIAVTVLALLCRSWLDPLLGTYVPYLSIFPAVIFSAWFCGFGPSVVSVIIAFIGETYWFIEPRHSLAISHKAHLAAALIYAVAAGFIIAAAESSRASLAQARGMQQHLEQLVKQRTAELEARNVELTEQSDAVRNLSSRLLTMRDEERRNIARELHDSVGQLATAMKMNLSTWQGLPLPETIARDLRETLGFLDQLITEVRTISYLLHPPLLDTLGLPSALKWFVDGFTQRSKIAVALDLQMDDCRLDRELELHLFRIAQECLTNVYRHSESPSARVRLALSGEQVRLEVSDAGKGIPHEKLQALESQGRVGVGLSGMRERVRQFGGTFAVTSSEKGAAVVVVVPLSKTPAEELFAPRNSKVKAASMDT